MPYQFIRGFAEGATKSRQAQQEEESLRKRAVFESMLRRKERQIPAAISPELEGLYKARKEAIPTELDVKQQQANTAELNAITNSYLGLYDNMGYLKPGVTPEQEQSARQAVIRKTRSMYPDIGEQEAPPSPEPMPTPTPKSPVEKTPSKDITPKTEISKKEVGLKTPE